MYNSGTALTDVIIPKRAYLKFTPASGIVIKGASRIVRFLKCLQF